MMRRAVLAFIVLGLAAVQSMAAERPSKPMPEATAAFVEDGRAIYVRRCSFCHGLLGDGEGPAAEFLDPRPRDFTLGTFKFRTTESGELPTDTDLFRTVSRGLKGTGMQAFDNETIKNGLSEIERWQVIAYIKTFAAEFADPELDPIKTGKVVKLPADMPPFSEELAAKGKAVFERAKCWECHGKQGRGNGQKSFDRKDDWGFPIRIRNVTLPWKIKGGAEPEDIYMRFSTGISGTPMPSFVKALKEQERWQLANFIKSLQYKATSNQVLKAHPIADAVPSAPDDAAWSQAQPIDIRLTGQVIAAPRWQNPSIELVTVRAIFNDTDIAFLIQWDDPFKDVTHDDTKRFSPRELRKIGSYNSYVAADGMIPRKLETFRDSIALQFPVKLPAGTKKPHFFRGASSNPVHLWIWKADKNRVDEAIARGWRQPVKIQPRDQQQTASKAVWRDGRWNVVMKRPRITADRNDVSFKKGAFIPMAVNAWDGSNGEHGLIMGLSSWYFVLLEAPTPISVYLLTVLAVVLTGGLGLWLVRKAQNTNPEAEETPA